MLEQRNEREAGKRSKASAIPENALGVPMEAVPAILGVGRTKAFALVRDGALESVKLGKSRIVTMRSIRALLHRDEAA